LQKPHAELAFEGLDPLGERRLGDLERLGRVAEVLRVRNFKKRP
jgi:hypothetical protein